jgi:tetratricopeptide (TPR) repeat protein
MTGLFSYPKRKLRKLIGQGEYEKAEEYGNELEAKFSKDPDFLFIMGSMYYMLNDEKKTLHYIDRVLEMNPYDVESLSLKLRVHQFLAEQQENEESKQNELNIVIDCCRKILDEAPDNFEVRDLITELES